MKQTFWMSDGAVYEALGAVQPPLWFVEHDKEPRPTSRPEVFRLEPFHFYTLTSAWQWFWFDCLMWGKYKMVDRSALSAEQFDELASAFSGLTTHNRAFTNGHGTDYDLNGNPGVNFITVENIDNPQATLPAASTLICGGTVLTGLESYPYLFVQTLDGSAPPPSIRLVNPITYPWLFTAAVVTTNQVIDGQPRVIPFPQLDGADVWVPIVSLPNKQPMRYPLSELRKLPVGAPVPSPYWPRSYPIL